ncbi:MAG: DUF1573 domain-containing protein [bacterium]|nr:DUF1573 domain-containing protein [bacterium]
MSKSTNKAHGSAGWERNTGSRKKVHGIGLVMFAAAAVLVLTGLFLAARWQYLPGTSGRVPLLRVSPGTYELGQVSQAKGIVTVELAAANGGEADLTINEMETSCGCTRAALIVNGKEGPWFGMRGHGEWPVGWSARLRPGERAVLRVKYDPDAHGIFRGPIDRIVVIHSNDPRQPQARVRLSGTQVP